MLIKVNAEKVILEYSTVGGLPDSIEYDGIVPDDFEAKFKPSFYMLQDDQIIENSNYVEPTVQIPDTGPSDQEKINAQLMLNQATQKQTQDAFNAQVLIQIAKLGGTR